MRNASWQGSLAWAGSGLACCKIPKSYRVTPSQGWGALGPIRWWVYLGFSACSTIECGTTRCDAQCLQGSKGSAARQKLTSGKEDSKSVRCGTSHMVEVA